MVRVTPHRRRCGNVEIARLGFWRDFQARWEPWESPPTSHRTLSARLPDFSTVSIARHFHSNHSEIAAARLTCYPIRVIYY